MIAPEDRSGSPDAERPENEPEQHVPRDRYLNLLLNAVTQRIEEEGEELSSDKITSYAQELLDRSREELGAILRERLALDTLRMLREWRAIDDEFKARLTFRWGAAIDVLEQMRTISHELGVECVNLWDRSPTAKAAALLRLHMRGCQIVAEILCLVKNGFPEGALGRWRTLHEVSVVASFLGERGDQLATRYLRHADTYEIDVERRYWQHAVATTGVPLITGESELQALENEYGPGFLRPNGWAAEELKRKRVRFVDIERAADLEGARYRYGIASRPVHAGAEALASHLGMLEGDDWRFVAGPSNTGLGIPMELTADSFTFLTGVTTARAVPGDPRVDHIVAVSAMLILRDELIDSVAEIQETLDREERERRSGDEAE
jgi:hypothetical protein